MERVGVQARHRAPTRQRPGNFYFRLGLLLIVTFGLTVAGVTEAYTAQDYIWMSIFIAGALVAVGVYFWVVNLWLKCIGFLGD